MAENSNQPKEYDAVLGGQAAPPVGGVVLGGIEGWRRRFATPIIEQKIAVLSDALKYGDADIDLLVQAMDDEALLVRVTAYKLLQSLSSTKAQQAIAKGVLLNEGDRIYSVYESVISYNDSWYEFIEFIEEEYEEEDEEEYERREPKLISHHLFKGSAEAVAKVHHQWRVMEEDISSYGWYSSYYRRGNFNIIEWCKANQILLSLPGESRSEFREKITNSITASQDRKYFRLDEVQELINKEYQRDDSEVENCWEVRLELEQRVVELLKATQNYELLGQLWVESVGNFAFVREEIVTQKTYFTGDL